VLKEVLEVDKEKIDVAFYTIKTLSKFQVPFLLIFDLLIISIRKQFKSIVFEILYFLSNSVYCTKTNTKYILDAKIFDH